MDHHASAAHASHGPSSGGHHQHEHRHHGEHGGHDNGGVATVLEFDAALLGSYRGDVAELIARRSAQPPQLILDIGAGTGTGTIALAQRFPTASVVGIDMSDAMLERLNAAAREHSLADRVRGVRANLDTGWPQLSPADVVWASSSLHHFADPDRIFVHMKQALKPGGTLAVIELDAQPRFLPDDIGIGRPGLEARCHAIIDARGWNAHPDWQAQIERAGFVDVEQHHVSAQAAAVSQAERDYARTVLSRIRAGAADQLDAGDRATLDELLAGDGSASIMCRNDLVPRSQRTVWLGSTA